MLKVVDCVEVTGSGLYGCGGMSFPGCDVLWTSGGQSKFHGEWASLSNRMASLPVHWHTSGSSCHTPAADMIE